MMQKLFEEFSSELKPKHQMLSKGEILFKQGDCVTNIYFIKKGRIKLIRTTLDGTQVVLHIGRQGESIAEASLFSDQYHCTATVDLAAEILSVNKLKLMHFLKNNSSEMISLLNVFSRQVRDLRALNELKNIRSAKQRILTYLRSNVDEKKELKLNLSLKDIAQKIGLAHETFYRELAKLEESGELQRDFDRIKLL